MSYDKSKQPYEDHKPGNTQHEARYDSARERNLSATLKSAKGQTK